jgi:hypothetical protein
MKTKLVIVVMALAIFAWAGTSIAAELTAGGRVAGQAEYVPGNRTDVEIWCQPPDFEVLRMVASQLDISYPFEAWAIDDYTSPGDEAVTKVQWWGLHWNSDIIVPPSVFIISFWEYDGTCYPGLPPTLLYQHISTDFELTELGVGLYEYVANIPPFLQDAGQTYWLTIQAVMEYFPDGQWGWLATAGITGCEGLILFPALEIVDWEPVNPDVPLDHAFCLFYDDEDPISVEASSWGSVKALFN